MSKAFAPAEFAKVHVATSCTINLEGSVMPRTTKRMIAVTVILGIQSMALSVPSSGVSGDTQLKIVGSQSGLAVVGKNLSFMPTQSNRASFQDRLTQSARTSESPGEMSRYFVQDARGRAQDYVLDRTIAAEPKSGRRVGWVQTTSSIGIEWTSKKNISRWSITLPSGQELHTTKNYLVDNTAAESGTYLITGSTPDGGVESFILTVPENTVSSINQKSQYTEKMTGDRPDQYRAVVWDAFIEDEFVGADVRGLDACVEAYTKGYEYYGGNGRGFADSTDDLYSGDDDVISQDEHKFKVSSALASNWGGTDWVNPWIYDYFISAQTGVTRAYDENMQLLATAQTDAGDDITLVESYSHSDGLGIARRTVKVDSSNPLCSLPDGSEAPAISVDYEYQHDSSGYVTVDGSHDQAPMHEVLWVASSDEGDPSKPHGCLYRFPNQGFTHLADAGFNNADVLLDFNPVLSSPECTTVIPE